VVLRKAQHGVSIADEHDSERIAAYCRELGPAHGLALEVVLPAERARLADVRRWDGFLFVGADDFVRTFIEQQEDRVPVFLWAKGYDLTIDARWPRALGAVRLFFNSSYLSAVEDRHNDRTQYLPTAFHNEWPWTLSDWLGNLRNGVVDLDVFDLVFSGSDRHVRSDRYRQRLLNVLARRGMKVCVAAPSSAWNRPHRETGSVDAGLDRAVRLLGNWGSESIFRRARCVLDLPWLDNVFHDHPAHHDPNRSIFALGWNIFRAGAWGARLLTYDCPANRDLGLSDEHCLFYHSDVSDVDALADEIVARVGAGRRVDWAPKQVALGALFHERHTYRVRWAHICRELQRHYGGDVAA
jgi:hypothetical protein